MEIVVTLDDIQNQAQYFWENVPGRVFAFHGPMGSGKTTFIAALCMAKGVTGHISSPTFSLINEYLYQEAGTQHRITHLDLYRLHDEQEAIHAGIEDCLYAGNICFIEWPERIPGLLPPDRVDIFIQPVDNQTRLLKVELGR